MFDFTGHNIFMATHAHMFQYLPITKESAVKADMYGASAVFISFSKQVGETFNSMMAVLAYITRTQPLHDLIYIYVT